jgi:inner membrane protein
MASLFTHAFVGAALGQSADRDLRRDWRFWFAVIACSILPDIDSVGFHLGVPYGALWGHRGMTHSLLFAFVVATFFALLLNRRFHSQWRLALLFFLITASHGVLDAMTDGGLGVAFFSPFDTDRYFFFFRPIHVSPIGVGRFFTARGWRILSSEIVWVWCPTLVLLLVLKAANARQKEHPETKQDSTPVRVPGPQDNARL